MMLLNKQYSFKKFTLCLMMAWSISISSHKVLEASDSILENIIERVTDTSCYNRITKEEELFLLLEIGEIHDQFFWKFAFSYTERDEKIENLLNHLNPTQDKKKDGVLKAWIAKEGGVAATHFFYTILMKKLSGEEITGKEKEVIAGLNVEDPTIYIEETSQKFSSYFNTLKQEGAKFNSISSWDLSDMDLNIQKLKHNPALLTALMVLFSPHFALSVADSERRKVLIVGNQVYLPPSRNIPIEDLNGSIQVISLDAYKTQIKAELSRFQKATEDYLKASRETFTYSNMMRGALRSGERGYKGLTAPEIERDAAYKAMLHSQSQLINKLGVSQEQEMKKAIDQAIKYANALDRNNLELGLAKIDFAKKAAIAAPLIPLAMAAAPIAGGLLSPTLGKIAAASSTTLAFMPLAFGTGLSFVNATIEKSKLGGNWFCYLAEELSEKGVEALYIAPFLASIPTVASAIAGAPIYAGAELGYVGMTLTGVVVAPNAYGFINLSTAIYFVKKMVESGIHGISSCHEKLKLAYDLAQDQNNDIPEEHLNALTTEAYKHCAEGGVDLAFAITGGTALARGSFKGFKTLNDDAATSYYWDQDIRRLLDPKREISDQERRSLYEASHVGRGEMGADGKKPAHPYTYTAEQLTRIKTILRKAGFSGKEVFQLMIPLTRGLDLIPLAEKILGRSLWPSEYIGICQAYRVVLADMGQGKGLHDCREIAHILKKAGFEKQEIRKLLKEGLFGKVDTDLIYAPPFKLFFSDSEMKVLKECFDILQKEGEGGEAKVNTLLKIANFTNDEIKDITRYIREKWVKDPEITESLEFITRKETQRDGSVAILWFPKYPDLPLSCTHMKLVVDGLVYGTMNEYGNLGGLKKHERLGGGNIRHSFIKFALNVSPGELLKLRKIVENNDYRVFGLPGCVQGACSAISRGTGFKIPPPFNQLPSLAALYMATMRLFNHPRIEKVEIVGKKRLGRILLSPDILMDGLMATEVVVFVVMTKTAVMKIVFDEEPDSPSETLDIDDFFESSDPIGIPYVPFEMDTSNQEVAPEVATPLKK